MYETPPCKGQPQLNPLKQQKNIINAHPTHTTTIKNEAGQYYISYFLKSGNSND